MLELIERHRSYHPGLLNDIKITDLVQSKGFEARRLHHMDTDVKTELRRLKSFTSFNVSMHGILWAVIDCQNNIEEMLVSYYLQKFPGFAIVLETAKGTFYGEKPTSITHSTKSAITIVSRLEKTRALTKQKPTPIKNRRYYFRNDQK
ncbi:MAG: hypothetical protein ABIH34_02875 [Nanoarchaeota archaeon]